jgi:hypothetical protein
MVVIEEVDEVEAVQAAGEPKGAETKVRFDDSTKAEKAEKAGLKKGFLSEAAKGGETLYGPEGSPEGEVSDEVKANWMNRRRPRRSTT